MSFGEFIFSVGFTQKTAKEDLNIKRYREIILWCIHGKVFRGHQRTPNRGRAMVGSHHELLEYSSTASYGASQPFVKSV
jgi:hypothetical protein